ncbi:TlpA family protein disulfide reductase [Longispora urticae]
MRRAVWALVAVLALAGCQGGKDSQSVTNQQRYVAGDGTSQVFEAGQRKKAPTVSGTLLDGAKFALPTGRVTVINFWASWCAPCRTEADDLEQVYQASKDKGVDFLGIDFRDGQDAARSFAEGRMTYPSLFDPAGKVALSFRDVPPNTIPATIILDKQGRVAAVIRKPVGRDELQKLVDPIAAEQ